MRCDSVMPEVLQVYEAKSMAVIVNRYQLQFHKILLLIHCYSLEKQSLFVSWRCPSPFLL